MARRADEYMKAGDFERAKLEYTNLLRADPNNPEPYEKIGRIWLDEGVPLRAGPFLVRAKELAPARAEVRVRLAELYIAMGALNEARQEALEALRLQPGNQEALLMLADVARTPEEIAAAEEVLQRTPQTDTDTYHLATATLALRKNDQAALDAALTK